MLRILLYALLAWFLYNLVFRLIVPVYRTTKQVKKKFREMHERMQQEEMRQKGFQEQYSPQNPAPGANKSDYIDFEEIK